MPASGVLVLRTQGVTASGKQYFMMLPSFHAFWQLCFASSSLLAQTPAQQQQQQHQLVVLCCVIAAIVCCYGVQSQYVIQQRNVTHLEAHASGVKEEEIRPVIAFLRKHLGLASAEELTQPAAAAAGAATGEPKEGLDLGTAEELAEVQFPATE